MKVLFMFSGLPHYYNLILSRLNNIPNLEVIVLIPQKKEDGTIGDGVHHTKEGINFKVFYLPLSKIWYKFFYKTLPKLLEKEQPEIIVTSFYFAYGFLTHLPTNRVMKKYDIKLIYKDIPFRLPYYKNAPAHHAQVIGLQPNDNFLKQWTYQIIGKIFTEICKILYNKFDGIVNYVEKGKDIYGSYGVPSERIFITYNSLDTELLIPIRIKARKLPPILPDNPYRIFHIGRLVEWKRVDLLIQSVNRLKNIYPNIELLIIGKGPLLAPLKQLTKDLQLENHVRFLGAIYDDTEKARYFQACSLYVLAGMGGLSINEAMTFGLPVLCSVCDGTEKHLVFEGINGRYFKDGNLNDLTLKLKELLSDLERLKEMGRQSIEIIDNKINVHTVLEGYIEAFNYVTQNRFRLSYKRPIDTYYKLKERLI